LGAPTRPDRARGENYEPAPGTNALAHGKGPGRAACPYTRRMREPGEIVIFLAACCRVSGRPPSVSVLVPGSTGWKGPGRRKPFLPQRDVNKTETLGALGSFLGKSRRGPGVRYFRPVPLVVFLGGTVQLRKKTDHPRGATRDWPQGSSQSAFICLVRTGASNRRGHKLVLGRSVTDPGAREGGKKKGPVRGRFNKRPRRALLIGAEGATYEVTSPIGFMSKAGTGHITADRVSKTAIRQVTVFFLGTLWENAGWETQTQTAFISADRRRQTAVGGPRLKGKKEGRDLQLSTGGGHVRASCQTLLAQQTFRT